MPVTINKCKDCIELLEEIRTKHFDRKSNMGIKHYVCAVENVVIENVETIPNCCPKISPEDFFRFC